MFSNAPYATLFAETQQQAVKTLESGFDVAAKILDLQKKYVLGVAGAIATATAPSQD